jgi:opacity protein-like surface antigen
MKKVLLTAVAVFSLTFVNAQEEKETTGAGFSKGDLFLSGAVSINSAKTGDFKASSFEIAPKVGYFLTENIAAGAKIGYKSDKLDNGTDDATNSGLGLGAFGRYYFTPASNFSLFAELGFDYTSYDNEFFINTDGSIDVPGSSFKSKEIGLGLGLGLNYFVSNNWSIEASWAGLGYTSNDNGGDGAEKTNTFGLGADLRAISFGVNYKF